MNRRDAVLALIALGLWPLAARGQDTQAAVPFVTTPHEVVERMLRIAATGPDDKVLDLGSGDGRIPIAAARDFGARGVGIELDAKLVSLSRENARRAGVASRTEFHEGDVLKANLSGASVVTVYLLPFLIDQLQPKFLEELAPGTRIVTHAYGMKGWRPDRSEKVRVTRQQEQQSRGESSEIQLWYVPAQARGQWQARDWRLSIQQNFQEIEVVAETGGRPVAVSSATLQGTAISFAGEGFSFRGTVGKERIGGELTRAGSSVPLSFGRR